MVSDKRRPGLRRGTAAILAAGSMFTQETLAEPRNDPWGDEDWHPSVGDCVRVILEEEWAHLRYIRRDLALLTQQS